MTQYLYPQNLKATANLWLWGLRDFVILGVAALLVYRPSGAAADGRAAGADAVLWIFDNPLGGQHGAGFSDSCGAVFYFDAAIL